MIKKSLQSLFHQRHSNMKDFMNLKDVHFCVYNGSSMYPALQDSDLLEVFPYGTRKLRRGDVIIFLPPDGEKLVVHRIMKITSKGVRTQGDNNPLIDPYTLSSSDIHGQVQAVWRGRKRKRILGGLSGLLLAGLTRHIRRQGVKCLLPLRAIYRTCSQSGLFACCIPSGFQVRIVMFQRHDNYLARLLLGSRVIGYYDPSAERWKIRRPYRLFINERRLLVPQQPTKNL